MSAERPISFADLSWMQVAERLRHDCRVVVPLGATEEHGHLSLTTDTHFVGRVALRACERAGVLLAPALPFGCSAFAIEFPGTISLRTQTLCMIVADMVDSLYRQGFRRLVFVTGHGGNEVATGVMSEVQLDRPGLAVQYLNGWAGMGELVAETEQRLGLPRSEHAAWHEAFDFARVGDVPRGCKDLPASPDFPVFPMNPRRARAELGEGVVSGAFVVDDEDLMRRAIDACVNCLADALAALPTTPPDDTRDADAIT